MAPGSPACRVAAAVTPGACALGGRLTGDPGEWVRLALAGGGVAAGGIGLAKAGVLVKVFLWLFVWNGVSSAVRIGGWIGILLVLAIAAAAVAWRRSRA